MTYFGIIFFNFLIRHNDNKARDYFTKLVKFFAYTLLLFADIISHTEQQEIYDIRSYELLEQKTLIRNLQFSDFFEILGS